MLGPNGPFCPDVVFADNNSTTALVRMDPYYYSYQVHTRREAVCVHVRVSSMRVHAS